MSCSSRLLMRCDYQLVFSGLQTHTKNTSDWDGASIAKVPNFRHEMNVINCLSCRELVKLCHVMPRLFVVSLVISRNARYNFEFPVIVHIFSGLYYTIDAEIVRKRTQNIPWIL